MNIRFGLYCDSPTPDLPKTEIGHVTVGPAGFLSILETQLGLPAPADPPPVRLMQYRKCLGQLDHENRFYHRSFRVDEIGVTKTLLSWRDQWYMAGWNGEIFKDAGDRLKDMGEIEAIAQKTIAPSMGQRLQNVLHSFDTQSTQIEYIELDDAFDDLPYLWQALISRFRYNDLKTDERKPSSKPGLDLRMLQELLFDLNKTDNKKPFVKQMKGDGSVVVLKASSNAVTARFLAEYIRAKKNTRGVSVLAAKNGAQFDDALECTDQARCGFKQFSTWRPALQVLPLSLNLVWKPVNPAALIQFLTHPITPLPKKLCRRLARVVMELPGVGSRLWHETIDEFIEEKRKEGQDAGATESIREKIDHWLPTSLFDPLEGIPARTAAERAHRISLWLGGLTGMEEDVHLQSLYAAAQKLTSVFANTLALIEEQGKERVDKLLLDRLLQEVSGQGIAIPDKFAECGHIPISDSPATFVADCKEIIWLDFSMPDMPGSYPWSRTEISAMRRKGVHLRTIDDELQYVSKTWLRPVMSATERIMFVIHESDEERHPLWDQIVSCTEGWVEFDVEDTINGGNKRPWFEKSDPIEFNPLPPLKRWWHLNETASLPERTVESYSSLDALIKSPYQWVLQHKAKLFEGNFYQLPSGNLLKGSLAHRLFEMCFSENKNWAKMNQTGLRKWFEIKHSKLLEEEGAVLLMPGMTMEREDFLETTRLALLKLVDHLKSAGLGSVRMELPVEGSFKGGKLRGYVDLVAVDNRQKEVIIDIKWGGMPYRGNDLRKNQHLQILIYSCLRKQMKNDPSWPHQAYFIIDTARMLSQSNTTFPSAVVFAPESEASSDKLWQRFVNMYMWRRKQLNAGKIEVTVTGTEPDDESVAPESGFPIDSYNDTFNDFVVLTGWEGNA